MIIHGALFSMFYANKAPIGSKKEESRGWELIAMDV